MKHFIVILSLLLIYSCAQPVIRYSATIPKIHPDSIKTQMLPVSVGNYWNYEIFYRLDKIKDTLTVEVLSIDTINVHAYNKDTSTLAYKLNWNRNLNKENNNNYFYYIKSEKQTQFVRAIGPESKKINNYLEITYEEPGTNMIDPDDSSIRWVGMRMIDTKFGRKNCYYVEATINNFVSKRRENDLIYQITTYYLKGVGIVREECYNSKGVVFIERDLIDYKVK